MKIIDVNTVFGHWPIQRFVHRSLHDLDCALESSGITESWLSSAESLLFEDPDVYDFPLFQKLREYPRFRPVKTVNPLLANWEQSALEAIQCYKIVALKICPTYHGYPSNHENLQRLASFAGLHNLPLLVSLRVNDERNQPEVLRIPPLNLEAMLEWIPRFSGTRFFMLCPLWGEVNRLCHVDNAYVDLSFLDQADVIKKLTTDIQFPLERVLFGSHACFMYPESSTLKLGLTECSQEVVEAIASGNVRRISDRGVVS